MLCVHNGTMSRLVVVCSGTSLFISTLHDPLSTTGMTSTAPTVTGLNVFPIKSCQAVVVQELTVDSYGVVDDRRLMVVDTNGRFISQRRCPVLATVTAYYKEEGDKRFMVVSSPTVSEELVFEPLTTGPRLTCSVWESSLELVDQGNAAAEWFSNLIGQCGCYRLVGCGSNEGYTRLVDNLPPSLKHRLPAMSLSLADSGPVSLISQESLDDLNTRMKSSYGTQVAFDRFRMNIEVSGCRESFEEDHWLLVKVGTVPFLVYTSAEVSTPFVTLIVV